MKWVKEKELDKIMHRSNKIHIEDVNNPWVNSNIPSQKPTVMTKEIPRQ